MLTTGILMLGKMSVGVERIESGPRINSNIANTTKVYGRRRARRTIHIFQTFSWSIETAKLGRSHSPQDTASSVVSAVLSVNRARSLGTNSDDTAFSCWRRRVRATTKYASYRVLRIQSPRLQYKSEDSSVGQTFLLPASLTDILKKKTLPSIIRK